VRVPTYSSSRLYEAINEDGRSPDKRRAGNDTLRGIRGMGNESERERSEEECHHAATDVLEAEA
jgi:hypothetical protein